MASPLGRGAQVILDGEAQAYARGAGGRLLNNLVAKQALEYGGTVSDGNTPDGSTPLGSPADDYLLGQDGDGGGGGGGLTQDDVDDAVETALTPLNLTIATLSAQVAALLAQGEVPLGAPTADNVLITADNSTLTADAS